MRRIISGLAMFMLAASLCANDFHFQEVYKFLSRPAGLSMSMDGCEIIVAVNNDIIISSDKGKTWKTVYSFSNAISRLAASHDGGAIAVIVNGAVMVSKDGGSLWEKVEIASGTPEEIALSKDGSYLAVSANGRLYIKTFYPADGSWIQTEAIDLAGIKSIALDANCARIAVVSDGKLLYRDRIPESPDISWRTISLGSTPEKVSFDSDGDGIIVSSGKKLLLSKDQGKTWSEILSSPNSLLNESLSSENCDIGLIDDKNALVLGADTTKVRLGDVPPPPKGWSDLPTPFAGEKLSEIYYAPTDITQSYGKILVWNNDGHICYFNPSLNKFVKISKDDSPIFGAYLGYTTPSIFIARDWNWYAFTTFSYSYKGVKWNTKIGPILSRSVKPITRAYFFISNGNPAGYNGYWGGNFAIMKPNMSPIPSSPFHIQDQINDLRINEHYNKAVVVTEKGAIGCFDMTAQKWDTIGNVESSPKVIEMQVSFNSDGSIASVVIGTDKNMYYYTASSGWKTTPLPFTAVYTDAVLFDKNNKFCAVIGGSEGELKHYDSLADKFTDIYKMDDSAIVLLGWQWDKNGAVTKCVAASGHSVGFYEKGQWTTVGGPWTEEITSADFTRFFTSSKLIALGLENGIVRFYNGGEIK